MEKTTSTRRRKYARRVKDKFTLHGVSEHDYEPFNYDSVPLRTPSTQIRLLKLFPASKYSDPLRCQLFTVTLSRAPRYRALSYVWGDGTKTHKLSVLDPTASSSRKAKSSSDKKDYDRDRHRDGYAQQQIPITSSLNTSLRHLRSLPTLDPDAIPIIIWIDQICINQSDNEEKSHQVQLMGQIYSQAMKVLVWLGPAADGSDEVMDALGELGREWAGTVEKVLGKGEGEEGEKGGKGGTWEGHVHSFMREYWTDGKGEVQDLFEKTLRTVIKLQKGDKLKKWYTRPWFTRIWTIQEFCLCEDTVFVCGAKIAHHSAVGVAIRLINFVFLDWDLDADYLQQQTRPELIRLREEELKMKVLEGSLVELLDCRDIKLMSPAELTLLPLMKLLYVLIGSDEYEGGEEAPGPQATRYRDRVYGLLGLAADAEKLAIKPDYSRQTGIVRVLTDTARAFVKNGGTLEVLSYAQFPKLGVEEMESSEVEGEGEGEPRELPSWVPDWRPGLLPSYYVIENRKADDERIPLFTACGKSGSTVEVVPTESPYMLGLRGYLVDTIEECSGHVWSDQTLEENDYRGIAEYFASLERLCQLSEQQQKQRNRPGSRRIYETPGRQQEALCRVAVGDRMFVMEEGYQRLTSEMVQVFNEWLEGCRSKAKAKASSWLLASEGHDHHHHHHHQKKRQKKEEEEEEEEEEDEWIDDAGLAAELAMTLDQMSNKRPYLTEKGYLGMAQFQAQPGDVVAVFMGAEIAYVLRPVGGKGMDNTYTFVGEAYCDGVMDGEIMLTEEKREFFLV